MYKILLVLLLLVSCGGGSSSNKIGEEFILSPGNNFVLVENRPDKFISNQEITFSFQTSNYFNQSTSNHFGIVTRGDIAIRDTKIFGQGAIFGTAGKIIDGSQIESWFTGIAPENYLYSQDSSPILRDGITYSVKLTTYISPDRIVQHIRYTITDGKMFFDSGEVNDDNRYFDINKNAIWIGQVFDDPASPPWTIKIFDLHVNF